MKTPISLPLGLATSLLVSILGLPSQAQEQPPATPLATPPTMPDFGRPHIAYEKYTLPNGLQVILVPDHRVPKVFVDLMVHVGSKNESVGSTGLAHLFEHMMFEGSKNAPGEYMQRIEKLGGSSNAGTGLDLTNYFETVPSGALEYTLWLESDRLATLADSLTQERFDNQKSVVENERRERIEDQPYGLVDVVLRQSLYPAGHPYSHSVIGIPHELRAATLTDAKDFFATYYAPNNISMTLSGDFDPAAAKEWIAKYFGPLRPAQTILRPVRWTPHLDAEKIVDVRDHVAEERTYFVWPAASWASDDRLNLEVIARILNRRLSADLVYAEKPLCSEESVDLNTLEDSSEFVVMASARSGVPLRDVEHKVDTDIALLAEDGPTDQELRWARSRMEFGELSQLDTLQSTAELLNQSNVFAGNPDQYQRRWNHLETMTAADLQIAARRWITTNGRLLIRYYPDPSSSQQQAALDRSAPPAIHANPTFHAPAVDAARLPNGLQIFVVQRSGTPKISVLLAARAGDMYDPIGKSGLSLMTVSTMARGTATRTGTNIRDGMEAAGATDLETSVAPELASLDFDVVAKNLDPAFAILADVATHPDFKKFSFESQKQQWTDMLAQSQIDAGDIAQNIAPSLIFGSDHPFARVIATQKGLAGIQRDDLRSFYQSWWKPSNAAVIFAGDISLNDAIRLATKYLVSWSGDAATPVSLPPPLDPGAGKIYLVDKPGAPQTLIAQLLPAVGQNDPQRFPLTLASFVWSDRLNASLRETQGSTYGFNSSFSPCVVYGAWSASGMVQTDRTREALIELRRQTRMIAGDDPISDSELRVAKAAFAQGYASGFETTSGLTSIVANLWISNLPSSAIQADPDEMARTPLADVQAAAAHFARLNKASLLLIGDRSKIEPQIRSLNIGPIILMNADGSPVADR
jgi:zinc protease